MFRLLLVKGGGQEARADARRLESLSVRRVQQALQQQQLLDTTYVDALRDQSSQMRGVFKMFPRTH